MTTVLPKAEFEPVVLRLRDGRTATLRAVRGDDRERLQATVRKLSADSRYFRFFAPLRELPPQLLERATNPDSEGDLQLVAVVGEGSEEEIIAGARYAATAGPRDCEFAVTVADDWHRLGLARQLLEALMAAARARGFERMEGYILASNAPMLALAKRLGFARATSPEGPTVCLVRRDLRSIG